MNDINTANLFEQPTISDFNAYPIASIIAPCCNEKKHISGFIECLVNQDYPHKNLEVIIADGMSNDGTREILEQICSQYEHIRIINNPLKIVSTALNMAIREARNDIIIRMDIHTEYAPDYVSKCVETLLRTGAGNVGGPARTKAITFLQKSIAVAYHSPYAVGGARSHFDHIEGEVDTVYLGCWYKETLLKIGLFDEEFVRNQDDELNFRIKEAGLKIWQNPAIKSWYIPRNNLMDLFKQYYQYGFWKFKVIRKHSQPASLRHLVPGIFVFTCLVLALMVPFLPIIKGFLLTVLASYLLFLITGSFSICKKSTWKYFPILPLILAIYHIAYGVGFLNGMLANFLGLSVHKKWVSSLSR